MAEYEGKVHNLAKDSPLRAQAERESVLAQAAAIEAEDAEAEAVVEDTADAPPAEPEAVEPVADAPEPPTPNAQFIVEPEEPEGVPA